VHEIRRLLKLGHSRLSVAGMFGLSRTAVYMIATGKTWGWLKEQEDVEA